MRGQYGDGQGTAKANVGAAGSQLETGRKRGRDSSVTSSAVAVHIFPERATELRTLYKKFNAWIHQLANDHV